MAKEKPLGMDTISFTAENPRKKKRKKTTKRRRKAVTVAPKKRRRKRKSLFGNTTPTTQGRKRRRKASSAPKRRRRSVRGTQRAAAPAPVTQGRKRRRKAYGKKARLMGGKRRLSGKSRTFGFGFNFSGIFDDLLSAATVALGGFGGLLAASYASEMIFGEKSGENTVTTPGDQVLGAGVAFLGLSLLENWMKPGGWFGNLFTGAKIFAVFSVLTKIYNMTISDSNSEWGSTTGEDTLITDKATTIPMRLRRATSLLSGASYLVDDEGEVMSLGAYKINANRGQSLLGAFKTQSPMRGAGYNSYADKSRLNTAVDSLMGDTANTQNYDTFRE